MNFFEFLRLCQDWLKMQHRKLECVLLHRSLVARGYCYLVEHNEKYYFLVNSYDFDIAQAWLVQTFPMTDTDTVMQNSYNGTPIVEDGELIRQVICGIYRLAS